MKIFSMLAAAVLSLSGTSTPVQAHCVNIVHSLALQSRGEEVVQLQKFLNVRQSGYFGPLTRVALIKWQIAAHLITSATSPGAGTTGPKTRAALHCPDVHVAP